MKMIIALLSLFYFSFTFAQSYQVRPGKLHKGGSLNATILSETDYTVKLSYEIIKRMWAPVPSQYLTGEFTFTLPSHFRDERGYLELEAKSEMEVPGAKLRFLKRTTIGELKNAYEVEVLPSNNKSKIHIVYHPDVADTGWVSVEIVFISQIPLLNGYELIADIIGN